MNQNYLDAEVIDIIDEAPGVKRYFLLIKDDEKFTFQPGQFVMLDFPIEHKFTYRSYSIASAPSDDNIIELCIVLKDDGSATPYMFENVKVGDNIKCTKPLGKFVLQEPIENDICLIATGTGVAPFRSMLGHIFSKNLPRKNVYLIFGNRKEEDILYRKEFEAYAEAYPEFKFIPVLSRETEETWEGDLGYVHPVYEKLFDGSQDATFYICGWSKMVREAKNRLKEFGYNRKQLKFELYD